MVSSKNKLGCTFVKRLASPRPGVIHGRLYRGTVCLDSELLKYVLACDNTIIFLEFETHPDGLTDLFYDYIMQLYNPKPYCLVVVSQRLTQEFIHSIIHPIRKPVSTLNPEQIQ